MAELEAAIMDNELRGTSGHDEGFSGTLSNLLRHSGPRRRVPIRVDGFARISDVQNALRFEDEELKKLVQLSCKEGQPRFEIGGEDFIRATRKHSISIDREWLKKAPDICLKEDLPLVAECERQEGDFGRRRDGGDRRRKESIIGEWQGKSASAGGIIDDTSLTWWDGTKTDIEFNGPKEFTMTMDGESYSAQLKDDGKLHWDDGTFWTSVRKDDKWDKRGTDKWDRRGDHNKWGNKGQRGYDKWWKKDSWGTEDTWAKEERRVHPDDEAGTARTWQEFLSFQQYDKEYALKRWNESNPVVDVEISSRWSPWADLQQGWKGSAGKRNDFFDQTPTRPSANDEQPTPPPPGCENHEDGTAAECDHELSQGQEQDEKTPSSPILDPNPANVASIAESDLNDQSPIIGEWQGKNSSAGGIIDGTSLTWWDGTKTPIEFKSPRELTMTMGGESYGAQLKDDGKLHWDDGTVWTSTKEQIMGEWQGNSSNAGGTIDATSLTWWDGTKTPVEFKGPKEFTINMGGESYGAQLKEDGKLHWDDGTVWTSNKHDDNSDKKGGDKWGKRGDNKWSKKGQNPMDNKGYDKWWTQDMWATDDRWAQDSSEHNMMHQDDEAWRTCKESAHAAEIRPANLHEADCADDTSLKSDAVAVECVAQTPSGGQVVRLAEVPQQATPVRLQSQPPPEATQDDAGSKPPPKAMPAHLLSQAQRAINAQAVPKNPPQAAPKAPPPMVPKAPPLEASIEREQKLKKQLEEARNQIEELQKQIRERDNEIHRLRLEVRQTDNAHIAVAAYDASPGTSDELSVKPGDKFSVAKRSEEYVGWAYVVRDDNPHLRGWVPTTVLPYLNQC